MMGDIDGDMVLDVRNDGGAGEGELNSGVVGLRAEGAAPAAGDHSGIRSLLQVRGGA